MSATADEYTLECRVKCGVRAMPTDEGREGLRNHERLFHNLKPFGVSPELACAFVELLIGSRAVGVDKYGKAVVVPAHPEIRAFLEAACRTPILPNPITETGRALYGGLVVNGEAHPLVEFFEGVAAQLRAYVEGQAK